MINILNDSAEIILCICAVVKHVTGWKSSEDNSFSQIYEVLCIVLSLLIYTITILALLPLIAFKKLLSLYLNIKVGSQCYGLLDGIDAVWASETEEAKHIVNTVIFMQFKESPEDFIVQIKEKIKDSQIPWLNSSLHSIFGYWYTVHSDTIVNKVIRPISLKENEISDKFQFEEKISHLANQHLPKSSVYELLVCTEPIKFYESTEYVETKTYAIIGRFHHVMGDGYRLLTFLDSLADEKTNLSNNIRIPLCTERNESINEDSSFFKDKFLNYLSNSMNAISKASVYFFGLSAPHDNNLLHGPNLGGNKTLVFQLEEHAKYLSKIKSIKRRITGCTFSDIMYTVVSASLWEHFSKYAKDVPKNITMSFISRFKNDFCAIALKIPIEIDGDSVASKHLTQRLNIIMERQKTLRQSVDAVIFYWLVRGCSYLPVSLSRELSKLCMKATVSLTNLPGAQNPISIGGNLIKDLVCWTPNVINVGIGFSVFSYKGRLEMGLIADKILLSEHEAASAILQNIFRYIDLLEEELNAAQLVSTSSTPKVV